MRIEVRALLAGAGADVSGGGAAPDARTATLRWPGFRVLAKAKVDDELQEQVQTTAGLVGCLTCAAVSVCFGRVLLLVQDLPCGRCPVVLCLLTDRGSG